MRINQIVAQATGTVLVGLSVIILTITAVPAAGVEGACILECVAELESAIEVTMFLAKSAMLSPNTGDLAIHAQEIIDLLEGNSDDSSMPAGIIEMAQSIPSSLQSLDLEDEISIEAINAAKLIIGFLESALSHAQKALSPESTSATVEMGSVYASLLAAYGLEDVHFSIVGVRYLPKILPNASVVVEVGESIQDAVDRVLPGGTVYIAPGIHNVETYIEIRKSLSLRPVLNADGVVLLQSIGTSSWNSGVIVRPSSSSLPFSVSISSIEIAGAGDGISVEGGEVSVDLENLVIHNCSRAAVSVTSGIVKISECILRENEMFGLALNGTANVDVVRSSVVGNGTRAARSASTLGAGIYVVDAARLSMSAVTVEGNQESGILVQDQSEIVLTASLVSDNRGDGLLASDAATLHIAGTGFLRNGGFGLHFQSSTCQSEPALFAGLEYTGRATGSSNRAPGPGEVDGNAAGGLCPMAYGELLVGVP